MAYEDNWKLKLLDFDITLANALWITLIAILPLLFLIDHSTFLKKSLSHTPKLTFTVINSSKIYFLMLEVRSQSIKTTIKEKDAMNPKENN